MLILMLHMKQVQPPLFLLSELVCSPRGHDEVENKAKNMMEERDEKASCDW